MIGKKHPNEERKADSK